MWAASDPVCSTWRRSFYSYSWASSFVSPITLIKPVTYCSHWVISQISFFIQILPASTVKGKKIFTEFFSYNSANTHLHFHQQWMHLLHISSFDWLTEYFSERHAKAQVWSRTFKKRVSNIISPLCQGLSKKPNSSPSYIQLVSKQLLQNKCYHGHNCSESEAEVCICYNEQKKRWIYRNLAS